MIEQNISVTAETKAIWLIFSGEKIFQFTENTGLMRQMGDTQFCSCLPGSNCSNR
jgi:hypothetical protein